MYNGIFVYGTLMSGFMNHKLYLADKIISANRAKIEGRLFHLPEGYPAVVDGNGWVSGEYFTVRGLPSVLVQLDELEGYYGPGQNNEYNRVIRDVLLADGKIVPGYVYISTAKGFGELARRGTEILSGDWRDFLLQHE